MSSSNSKPVIPDEPLMVRRDFCVIPQLMLNIYRLFVEVFLERQSVASPDDILLFHGGPIP